MLGSIRAVSRTPEGASTVAKSLGPNDVYTTLNLMGEPDSKDYVLDLALLQFNSPKPKESPSSINSKDSQIRLLQFFTSVAPDTIGASLLMFVEILRDWEQNPELNGISADKVGNLVFGPLQKAIPWLAFHMGDVFEVGMLYLATQYLFGTIMTSPLGEKLNPKLKKFISQKRRLLGAILSTIPIATFEITHNDAPDAIGAIGAALVILGLSKIVKTGVQKWLDNANIDTKQKRILKSML